MWIVGPDSLNKYDKFKAEIFGKKKDEFKQKYRHQKTPTPLSEGHRPTNHPFFKKVFILSLLGTGLYFVNQKFKIAHRFVTYVESFQPNPIYLSTARALFADTNRRFSTDPQQHTLGQTKNSKFANTCFLSQLNYYLKLIKEPNVQKIISEQSNSKLRFGPFKINNRIQRLMINDEGSVVRQSQRCKFKIGSLGMFGSKVQEIMEHQKTVNLFLKFKDQDFDQSCKIINVLNYLTVSSEKYQEIFEQCTQKSRARYEQIHKLVSKREEKQKSDQKIRKFFISFT